MKTSLYIFLTIALFSLLFTSCSTIFNGDKSDVRISSNPNDARIFVNGLEIGKTPAVLKLKRGDRHIIEVKKEGYQTLRLETSNTITGWFWGNIICGGILGIVIDLATGNAYDVDPSTIVVTLEKSTGMIERTIMEDFGSIKVLNDQGKALANVEVVWE